MAGTRRRKKSRRVHSEKRRWREGWGGEKAGERGEVATMGSSEGTGESGCFSRARESAEGCMS